MVSTISSLHLPLFAQLQSLQVIHRRLGHPNLNKLKKMVPSLSCCNLWSESCQLGKHVRSTFPSQGHRQASSPFDLVHSDVWGPSRVGSTLGFRYFVTFIDDFSRCTWIFLMKERSKLFTIFQNFCNEIRTQFGLSICILHSDKQKSIFLLHSIIL